MTKFLPKIFPRSQEERRATIERQLIRAEAKLGGQLFGPLAKGHDRQFFCLDEYTWIWYEAWKDSHGQPCSVTTRYEIRPNGIVKSQDGRVTYQQLSKQETRNLYKAAVLYYQQVLDAHQGRLQTA